MLSCDKAKRVYVPREKNVKCRCILLLLISPLLPKLYFICYLYFIFMYMHNNHCHRVTAHLQSNLLLLLSSSLIFFTSQLWLGNIRLSRDVVINRIMLGGLICSLKSFLQLNMCQDLQIFAVVYMYWGAS